MNSTSSRSAISAAEILSAWGDDNREQLNRRLSIDRSSYAECCQDSNEAERLELLEGIASQIGSSIESGRPQDANLYLSLLRHLAGDACTLAAHG